MNMVIVWTVMNIEPMKQNINWEAVLEELKYELRQKMKLQRQCDVDDERNPYDFAIMDLQEINFLFHRIPLEQRYMVLVDRLQKGLVHKKLTDIIASYPSYHIFLQQNPVDIAN